MSLRIPIIIIITLSVFVAACSGSDRSIAEVEKCLGSAGLKTETPTDPEPGVREGIAGFTGLTENQPTIAMAATVDKETVVDSFVKAAREFESRLTDGDRERFSVESGTDGLYVWVVAGDKSAKTFSAARECVKP